MSRLTKEETDSIKRSYLNIVGLFLTKPTIESKYLRCLLKWGFELELSPLDLRHAQVDITHLEFSAPDGNVERMESMYHLLHMICLDQVVEDVELEVASIYAERLGFARSLVSDLLSSIVTADSDGVAPADIRQQVMDFLRLGEK